MSPRDATKGTAGTDGSDLRPESLRGGFGVAGWWIEPDRNSISRGAVHRHLEGRVMDVLVALAGAGGDILGKDTLLRAVWPGVVVVEGALYRAVAELRAALEDDARNPRIIENVPKRGYRLLVPIETAGSRSDTAIAPEAPAQGAKPRRARVATGIAAGALVLATVAGLMILAGAPTTARHDVPDAATNVSVAPVGVAEPSIAVLPFKNMSDDPRQAWFAEGLSEEIIHTLSSAEDLRVMARTSSFAANKEGQSIADVRRLLNVDTVLEGSVRIQGDQIRVTAQLINARDEVHLWSKAYSGPRSDAFSMQEDIARSIVHSVRGMLTPQGQPTFHAHARPYSDFDAYQLYLEARYLWHQRNPAALRRSAELLQRAIDIDPRFASAYALLANVLYVSTYYTDLPYEDMAPRARAAAARALELDPQNAEAYLAIGSLESVPAHQEQAIAALEKSVLYSPTDSMARQRLGERLLAMGYLDKGAQQISEALKVDPLSASVNAVQALVFAIAGDGDQALRSAGVARQLGSARAGIMESWIYLERGNFQDAFRARAEALHAMEQYDRHLSFVYEALQHPDTSAAALAALGSAPPEARAKAGGFYYDYGVLGRHDLALAALGRLDGRQGAWGEIWLPELAPLRRDPRFVGTLASLGIVSYWSQHGLPERCSLHDAVITCR